MSDDRLRALRALIAYELPLEPALAVLASCSWDCEEPLTSLTASDVLRMLDCHSSGALTSAQLTDWADLLECREDIHLPSAPFNISAMMFRLANPNLEGPVTDALVEQMRAELVSAHGAV